MTKSEFEKVNELKEEVKKYEECKMYFEPQHRNSKSDIDKVCKRYKFPFRIFFKRKDENTIECRLNLKEWIGGNSIEVDEQFLEYCRAYFENKVKSLKAEIDSYFEKENTDND